jgi:hypothetical protein
MAEKKVNYGVQGIEDLVSDLNKSKDQNVTGQSGAIAIPSRKAVGRPVVRSKGTSRTSITLSPEVMGKLRSLALNTGRQLNDIIEESLTRYFENYEKRHGEITVPEIYRNN